MTRGRSWARTVGWFVTAAVAVIAGLAASAGAADDGVTRLDFSRGAIVPPWTAVQAAAPDRVQLVADPLGVYGTVGRFEVREGDSAAGGNRSEVYLKPGGVGTEGVGEEHYYAFSVQFPPGFTPPRTWGIVMQMHAADSAGTFPLVALETVAAGTLRLVLRGGNPKKVVARTHDLSGVTTRDGGWHDFILRWRRSTTADGLVQLWYRRGTTPFALRVNDAGPSFYADKRGRTEPAYIKLGFYRDGAKDGTHPSVVLHRGMWKASTLDGAAAFFGCTTGSGCF